MKPNVKILLLALSFAPLLAYAQVDRIKQKSSTHSESRRGGSGGSYSGVSNLVINLLFQIPFGEWQRSKLARREDNREITSLDISLQAGANPFGYYYLMTPRIRGNWGLVSTDFRFNYIVQDDFGKLTHLRTDDWQILQLNLVTSRNAIFRVGGGILHEAFGDQKVFGEFTTALQLNSTDHHLGGTVEFRSSEPRTEWSAQFRYKLFDNGALHGFATAGLIYQRYYQSVDIVGLQGGLVFKLY